MLVDLACGGGLMGPHVERLGYRHIGVDIGARGLELAGAHGVLPVRGSVLAVPLIDGCADVVLAGESKARLRRAWPERGRRRVGPRFGPIRVYWEAGGCR